MNAFVGMSEEELLDARDRLRSRLLNGSPVMLSPAPGMRDTFTPKSEAELRRLLMEVAYALYKLDPDRYENPYGSHFMRTIHYFV